MKTLEPAYVAAAALEARNLHQAHSPIRGLADEVGIEKATSICKMPISSARTTPTRTRWIWMAMN